ncbi:MAG: hypothetical protein WD512_00420, partial [Candidatus Paceibacterota bacterium]
MFKKLIFIVLISTFSFSVHAQFAGGSGTEEDPYLIESKFDLKYLSENSGLWSKDFKQISDIYFSTEDFSANGEFYYDGKGFLPIANLYAEAFSGTYNGNGKIIDSLYINRNSSGDNSDGGLFGFIKYSDIKNLSLTNVNIKGRSSVGALASGSHLSEINNVYVTGEIEIESGYIGGLIGATEWTTITHSSCDCIVISNASSDAGGIVGWLLDASKIQFTYSTGKVSGSTVGG